MSTSARPQDRRVADNPNSAKTFSSDSGAQLSPSSTASASTPPRRYILDVPTGRVKRRNRALTDQMIDEYGARDTQNLVTDGTAEFYTHDGGSHLLREGSADYYYRTGNFEVTGSSSNPYLEGGAIKQLLDSNPTYKRTTIEDEEVRALTVKATPDIKNYPINVDPNPELVVRPNTQKITYKQDIAVRYLKPNTPPPPGPIIIREIRAPAPPPAPPIVLRQRPPPPRTPSPIIIREKPPARPKSVPTTVIKKIIPPPPPPPRQLVIERLPNLPPKPRPVIIERWLPYHRQRRQVIHEKAKPLEPPPRIKNTIIEWRSPEVEVVKQLKKYGVTEADPQQYYTQHGDKLYTTEFVQRKLTELGLQEELALMQEQHLSASKEEATIEQAAEYDVRQILSSYTQTSSSRQNFTGGTIAHLIRSSSESGSVDEYVDQRNLVYDHAPENYASTLYETHSYPSDGGMSNSTLITEETLLRTHASNGGKLPAHVLTQLGSQAYQLATGQVEFDNNSRRATTRTANNVIISHNETGYGFTTADANETGLDYVDEKYVQMRPASVQDAIDAMNGYSNEGKS